MSVLRITQDHKLRLGGDNQNLKTKRRIGLRLTAFRKFRLILQRENKLHSETKSF